MANWDRKFSNGSFAGNWNGRLVYVLDYQDTNGNYSHVSLYLQVFSDSGAYTQNGSWDGRIYINGGQVAQGTPSANVGPSAYQLTSYGANLSHDANGNLTVTLGDYINAPVNEMVYGTLSWGLPRIPLAPIISATTADQIKPTTARLGTELSSLGHGTSATCRFYYRKQGDVSWLNTSNQADVGGYNYETITGLKPGTTYEYYSYWYNNNSDISTSSTQTFKTQSLSGAVPLLMGLL